MSISGLPAQFVLIDADTNDFPSDSNGVPALAVKDSENKVTVPASQYRRNTSDIWEETKTAKTGTLQSGATGTGNGTDFDVEGYGSVKLQITGTFVATITFYHSVDGTNFVPMPVRDIYNGTRVFSTNLTGVYDMDGNSVKKIRAVISAYTSGSITVIGRAEGVSGHVTFIEANRSKNDLVGQGIDNILNVIGVENIKLFLPLWEDAGATKCYDLLRRDLTFTPSGPVFGATGPFGNCAQFDGVNDYIIQDPMTENTAGAVQIDLNNGAHKMATRMVAIACTPGFVRLKIKKTEAVAGNLNSASVKVSIYTDNAGVPNALVTGAESAALLCSVIGTSFEWRGFSFPTVFYLRKGQKYWIVFEYVSTTGVDANNFISWQYEAAPGSYGERRAYFNAGWVATDTENHCFGLWDDMLAFEDDFSIITLICNTEAAVSSRHMYGSSSSQTTASSNALGISRSSSGYILTKVNDGTERNVVFYRWPSVFDVIALTFSKAKSSPDKIRVYLNGSLKRTGAGTGGATQIALSQPWTIGSASLGDGNISGYYWKGYIGTQIITKNELDAIQIGRITHELLNVRKYKGAAV